MATKDSSEISIVEEREELMITPNAAANDNPTLRTAHFLKPTLPPVSENPSLPKLPSISLSSKPRIKYNIRPPPLREWKSWVEKLQPTHEHIWKKVGIFEAIKSSTYQIKKHNELVISLAQRWCPETNTFIFPWGEATVTLEDVVVLGGFPVLGDSVLSSSFPLGHNIKHLEDRLINVRRELNGKIHNIRHSIWLECFMGSGDELEHPAFIALWLLRFVFPSRSRICSICMSLLPLAVRISSGIKIALAPPVLAAIYKDLSSLNNGDNNVILFSPSQLVHIWAWERFPTLGTVPKLLIHGEPRLARWDSVSQPKIHDLGVLLDSSGDAFLWRSYAMSIENWLVPGFYGNLERWVSVDSSEEWESFARCLRTCQLPGFDFVQSYHPHRVGMQFGMDQDIPCSFPMPYEDVETTWINYNTPITGMKLYVPLRLFDGDVTVRYSNWWNGTSLPEEAHALQTYKRKKTTPSSIHTPAVATISLSPGFSNMSEIGNLSKKYEPSPVENSRVDHDVVNINEGEEYRTHTPEIAPISSTPECSYMLETGNVYQNDEQSRVDENENEKLLIDKDVVSISDDEEEDTSQCPLETLASKLEAKLTELERVVSELTAAKFGK